MIGTPMAWLVGWIAPMAVLAISLALVLVLWRPLRRSRQEARLREARDTFRLRREALEAKFVKLASCSGKPRGLVWADCEFENPVAFARNRRDGSISAFVGVSVTFEPELDPHEAPLDHGPLGDDPADDDEPSSYERAGTAVFHHHSGRWSTDGRVVFNLAPIQAIQHFRSEYESVA